MTVAQAVAWCNSKVGQAMDFDGQYGAQCTDFFNYYYQMLTGRNPYSDGYAVPGAKDIWDVPTNLFDKIKNNPNDPNQLPPQGAVMIYDGALSGSGGAGHVVVIDSSNSKQVTVWDQNWGGMIVKHQSHMWTGHEIGWLVFKGFTQNINQDQLTQLYRDILHRDPDPDAVAHYTGNYTYDFVKQDLLNSKERQIILAREAEAAKPVPTPIPVPSKEDEILTVEKENNSLLKQILALLQGLVSKISSIFK